MPLKTRSLLLSLALSLVLALPSCTPEPEKGPALRRPNILIAISDDQSWPHASAYGAGFVHTPSFDRVARDGILFNNAFTTSPGCAPSRASIVLGRYPWQNEHAGNHNSLWPARYKPLPDYLRDAGYHVGHTGKGVGPFHWALGGRYEDPAGPEYNGVRLTPPFKYISDIDYAGNFETFLDEKPADQPFFFWYGATEPHRRYEIGEGEASGKSPAEAEIPPFLPDAPDIRGDLLDYAVEIEWFDQHLGRILDLLEERGELDNTLIFVTSDNGMPFPGAKASCYEYGTHVPLAVRWGSEIHQARVEDSLISLADLMPTILDATGVMYPAEHPISAESFLGLLHDQPSGARRAAVYFSRERHSSARWKDFGYPQRAIRTPDYLYIRNFKPERWPAGSPERLTDDSTPVPGFNDFDWGPGWGRSNAFVVLHPEDPGVKAYFEHAAGLRPAEQLFDIRSDHGCLHNLAGDNASSSLKQGLAAQLDDVLRRTGDARLVGPDPEIYESYPRYAELRSFPRPEWADRTDPDTLSHLLAVVDSNHEPVVAPTRMGDWGLEAGPWRLERTPEGGWNLLRAESTSSIDFNRRMPRLKSQLIAVYEWFGRQKTSPSDPRSR